MIEHLDKLIDARNQNLWNELNEQFEFILEESPENNYMSLVEGNIATIRIFKDDLNPSAFTHELLHVFLKSKKVFIQNDLLKVVSENSELGNLFSFELVSHIGNCLEHFIMFPIYLKMGFNENEFLGDYNEMIMNDTIFEVIKNKYKTKNIHNREAVDVLIGKFFAMKASTNKKFKHFKYYQLMQKLDKKMYNLLYGFWSDWETFDFLDIEDSYDEILNLFIEDLKDWTTNKTII